MIDPHTAVAAGVYQKYLRDNNTHTPTVIASTASPYKFTRSVMDAISDRYQGLDDFALRDALSALSGVQIPEGSGRNPYSAGSSRYGCRCAGYAGHCKENPGDMLKELQFL